MSQLRLRVSRSAGHSVWWHSMDGSRLVKCCLNFVGFGHSASAQFLVLSLSGCSGSVFFVHTSIHLGCWYPSPVINCLHIVLNSSRPFMFFLPHYARCHACMINDSPHPDPESRPPTTNKASPATRPVIKIGGPKNPCKLCRTKTHAKIEWRALSIQNAGISNERHGRRRERAQDGARVFAKQERCRTNPDLDVIDLVLSKAKTHGEISPNAKRLECDVLGGHRWYRRRASNISLLHTGVNKCPSRRRL